MTISKQFLQPSCLNPLVPQQKLPSRLHNNVCLLPQATRGCCLRRSPQNLPPSHNDLAILGSTINHLPFAASSACRASHHHDRCSSRLHCICAIDRHWARLSAVQSVRHADDTALACVDSADNVEIKVWVGLSCCRLFSYI